MRVFNRTFWRFFSPLEAIRLFKRKYQRFILAENKLESQRKMKKLFQQCKKGKFLE
jgi:hypothetical protein